MASLLEQSANRFRKQLLAGNDVALKSMADAYTQTWVKLKPQLEAITTKYETALATGDPISPSWLFRQDHYRLLMQQCEDELSKLSKLGAQITDQQVMRAVSLGQDHAQQMAMGSIGDIPVGYSVNWHRLPTETIEKMVGNLSDGSPLSTLMERYGQDAAQGIKNQLITGVAQGHNPRRIAAACRREFGSGLANILTVCRTEPLRAYRRTQLESYKANDHVVDCWIWHSRLGPHTCAGCYSRHGQEYPLTQDLQDHPNGACSRIPKTKSWKELFPNADLSKVKETSIQIEPGADRFAKLDEKKQRQILGPIKHRAYKDGKLNIQDIAGESVSREWGVTTKIKNLSELGLDAR